MWPSWQLPLVLVTIFGSVTNWVQQKRNLAAALYSGQKRQRCVFSAQELPQEGGVTNKHFISLVQLYLFLLFLGSYLHIGYHATYKSNHRGAYTECYLDNTTYKKDMSNIPTQVAKVTNWLYLHG